MAVSTATPASPAKKRIILKALGFLVLVILAYIVCRRLDDAAGYRLAALDHQYLGGPPVLFARQEASTSGGERREAEVPSPQNPPAGEWKCPDPEIVRTGMDPLAECLTEWRGRKERADLEWKNANRAVKFLGALEGVFKKRERYTDRGY